MRKLIVVCLLVISCAKEDFIEENIVVTKPITEIVVPIPEAPIEYTFSTFTVNHPLSAKIWQGLDIAFNGATNFVDGLGVETILLSPSMARWSQAETIDLPTIKLKKAGYWAITDYYEDINILDVKLFIYKKTIGPIKLNNKSFDQNIKNYNRFVLIYRDIIINIFIVLELIVIDY